MSEYLPWNQVKDFSSRGRATRIFGLKTNRIHHFHSDNQLRAFLLFEWSNKVIDIRESYPLLDLLEVVDKKDDLRLDKYSDKKTKEPYVLTTNFLLSIQDENGEISNVARSIKIASCLNKKIVQEKLEIESRYWSSKGVDFKVITNKELNRQYCKNIEWVRETLINTEKDYPDIIRISEELYEYLISKHNTKVKSILRDFEVEHELDKGKALYAFRHLIGRKKIEVDMKNKININMNIEDVILKFN